MKYRALLFRCSEYGERFCVVFGQHSPSHHFLIVKILCDEKEIGMSLEMSGNPSDHPQLEGSGTYDLEKTNYVVPDLKDNPQSTNRAQRILDQSETYVSFVAEEFDFSGWYCPYCGYAKGEKKVWPLYVHCNKCGELVCGARVHEVNKVLLFACYDSCGNSGSLEGSITSFSGKRIDYQERKLLPENPKQLPSSTGKPFLKPPQNE